MFGLSHSLGQTNSLLTLLFLNKKNIQGEGRIEPRTSVQM